jgi:hypothetical protein
MNPEPWIAVIVIAFFFTVMFLSTRTAPPAHEDPPRCMWLRGKDLVVDLDSVVMVDIREYRPSELRWVSLSSSGGAYHQIRCENQQEAEELISLLGLLLEFRRPCDINGSWGELEAL